jgi:DNA-binding transcriptional regulator YhcF (GntR family)
LKPADRAQADSRKPFSTSMSPEVCHSQAPAICLSRAWCAELNTPTSARSHPCTCQAAILGDRTRIHWLENGPKITYFSGPNREGPLGMGARQIYDRIRLSIANGKLRASDRLPSTRTLANEFNVARGTVESAYSLLVADGLLVGRGRKGTFVSEVVHFWEQPSAMVVPEERELALDEEDFRYLFDSPLPLMPGLPSFDQFPRKLWYRTVARQARAGGLLQLTYPDPLGLPQLRQALASSRSRGGYNVVQSRLSLQPDILARFR